MVNETQSYASWIPLSLSLFSFPLSLILFGRTSRSYKIALFLQQLALWSAAWFTLVSKTVQQPYLDEVFHIPQAQRYCRGRFFEWDDKITTPPGLYLFSIALQSVGSALKLPWLLSCDVSALRMTNVLGLFILASLALLCRHQIESRFYEARFRDRLKTVSAYAVHTAFNIALFPVLFFFSGLYYTDVISTAIVVGAYLNHLKRIGTETGSILSDLTTILLGLSALLMRQTNVFWIVVWIGGLEAVHAVKTLKPQRIGQPVTTSLLEQLRFFAWRYSIGDIHDVPLSLAWPDDMLFTAISLGIAALWNPLRILRQIWPYVCVLMAFAGFVVWNDGVVLGDKSNHVATIHLAQLLYIWPFFAFFSLPLLVPFALSLFDIGTATESAPKSRGEKTSTMRSASSLGPSLPLKTMSQLFGLRWLIWTVYTLAILVASVAVVKYNTIIHPFTLADNRHYVFYIFRYTIRRGPLARFLLILPYTISRWMIWTAWVGSSSPTDSSAYTSHPLLIAKGTNRRKTDGAVHPKDKAPVAAVGQQGDATVISSTEPVSTSTALIFLLATSLSLMTAPLVEPRYFIIPWVMWRLLVPAWILSTDGPLAEGRIGGTSFTGKMVAWGRRSDLRLVGETLWFVAINAVTGYIFLMRPYVWRDENGQVLDEGRLQRFMW